MTEQPREITAEELKPIVEAEIRLDPRWKEPKLFHFTIVPRRGESPNWSISLGAQHGGDAFADTLTRVMRTLGPKYRLKEAVRP